jgi:hypothetical protein
MISMIQTLTLAGLFRAAPVLQGGFSAVAQDVYELLGLGGLYQQLGGLGATALLFGVLLAFGTLVVLLSTRDSGDAPENTDLPTTDGGVDTADIREKLPGGEESSSTAVVEETENGIVEEATRRLQMRDEPVTGENLKAEIQQVKADASGESGSGRTGAISSPEERSRTERVAIAPNDIEEHESYLRIESQGGNEHFVRTMTMSDFPSRVSPGWLSGLFTNSLSVKGARVIPKMRMAPRDPSVMMRQLNIRMTRVKSEMRRKQRNSQVNTTKEEQQQGEIKRLLDGLESGNAKMFDFSLYVEIVADDRETLDEATDEIRQMMAKLQATLTPLHDRQRDAMTTVAPLGIDHISNTQLLDQRSLAATFPFVEPSLVMPGGVLVGTHLVTNTPVIIDRFALSGYNWLITGKIGSGKSYLAKLLMWRRIMIDADTEVLMIDPVGGFTDLTEAFGDKGQRVVMGGNTVINILEIKAPEQQVSTENLEENNLEAKIRSVMGILRSHFDDSGGLSASQEGVLRRTLKMAYLQQGITKDPSTHHRESPIMDDVLDILRHLRDGDSPRDFLDVPDGFEKHLSRVAEDLTSMSSGGPAQQRVSKYAQQVLLGLEDFRQGGQFGMLNGRSNVELDAQCVQFDLDNVGDPNDAGVYMHVVLDWLFQRAKATNNNTLVTIDEAHYMLGEEGPKQMLNTFARHSRHNNSGMTLISQTAAEFVRDEDTKEIYDQCDVRALMKHKDLSEETCKRLNLNERDRQYVLDAMAGENHDYATGLIHVSDHGKLRTRIKSNPYEHHIIDQDLNVWAYLVANGQMSEADVPEAERPVVREILSQQEGNQPAD